MVSLPIRSTEAAQPLGARDRPADGTARATGADGKAPQDRVTISGEARARAAAGTGKLTAQQQLQLVKLQQRDAHVRQHEAAHQAAGGSLTGGASFTFQVGPDGRSYAVGGEVPVRLASGRTPDETIANARQARRAALAPADPSGADLAVAAAATQMEAAAVQRRSKLAGQAYGKARAGRHTGQDEVERASYDGSGGRGSEDEEPAVARQIAA